MGLEDGDCCIREQSGITPMPPCLPSLIFKRSRARETYTWSIYIHWFITYTKRALDISGTALTSSTLCRISKLWPWHPQLKAADCRTKSIIAWQCEKSSSRKQYSPLPWRLLKKKIDETVKDDLSLEHSEDAGWIRWLSKPMSNFILNIFQNHKAFR